MVVIQNAGPITVTAQNVQPAGAPILWVIQRNPADTVLTTGTPTLSTTSGSQTTLTPNTPGSFRLIAYVDKNSNGQFNTGEQLRVLRMSIFRINLQGIENKISRSDPVTFTPSISGSGVSTANTMSLSSQFLLEGGNADRRLGVEKIVLGDVGNLTQDTFIVNYETGTEREDPDGRVNPAAGFPSPMVDTSRVAAGAQPSGGMSAHRSTSAQTSNGNGPNGGELRTVTSQDNPGFSWDFFHPTNGSSWQNTTGANNFTEFIVGYSDTFPRTYSALVKATWSVSIIGSFSQGRWQNNGSSVTIQGTTQSPQPVTSLITAGAPTTGDAAGVQVLGLSFVNEKKMIP